MLDKDTLAGRQQAGTDRVQQVGFWPICTAWDFWPLGLPVQTIWPKALHMDL